MKKMILVSIFALMFSVPSVPTPNAQTTDKEVDSALKEYVYPGSELEGQFSMGNMLSVQYISQDEFIHVVNHYKKKFPDTNIGSGTSVYFGKQTPDGGDLTVTLTELDNGTQIILKLIRNP